MTLSRLPKFLPLLAVLLLANGCAQQSTTPVATEPDLVSTRIAQAAEKAAKALDTISGIEQVRSPIAPQEDDYASAPPSLTQTITVKWAGPVEQMLQTLATRAGLRFRASGPRPPVALTIAVDAYQKPMIEVLKDIGLQAGRRADVRVDPTGSVIEIRYAAVDRI
jgi:defect-in-organelle-trafficking protein DotD